MTLRQYEPRECVYDGYPWAWGHETMSEDQSQIVPPIKDQIREQAMHRCERCWHPYAKGEGEWSRCDEACKHGGELRVLQQDGEWLYCTILSPLQPEMPLTIEARYRILTVHHLDEDKGNCRWWNLVALCQRCHLRMQRKVVMDRPWHYEHTEWFRPYAAAFYAFKYLGEDLSREETMARLDDLLKLEHRFTQGVLL